MYTFPNQRTVTVHREPAKSDFLGIKNANWQAAARDLSAQSLKLYLYFASNANGYTLALSPTAIRNAIGMAPSTYHENLPNLIKKGYLVPTGANSFDFFEVPRPAPELAQKASPADGLKNEEYTPSVYGIDQAVHTNTEKDIEINNRDIPTKPRINISGLETTTEVKVPEEKIVYIKRPVVERKKELLPKPEKTGFVF